MLNKDSRYAKTFKRLELERKVAWIPFIMLGYPDLQSSLKFIEVFADNGADALEIGIPFSDPVADGELIQEAARVALEQGITVELCFAAMKTVRDKYPDLPIGLLTYANLVYRPGIDNFYASCRASGVDSVLIADLPLSEAEPFIKKATSAQIEAVLIAPPNATDRKLQDISQRGSAYTYVVSRAGVTGDANQVEYPLQVLKKLQHYRAPAAVLGFGISEPGQVRKAVAGGFRGVISGSAIIRLIANNEHQVVEKLRKFSLLMNDATKLAAETVVV